MMRSRFDGDRVTALMVVLLALLWLAITVCTPHL
jgi:hypothetical protein